jgi:hypothetical protein
MALYTVLFLQAETEAAMKQAESATRAAETLLKAEGDSLSHSTRTLLPAMEQ